MVAVVSMKENEKKKERSSYNLLQQNIERNCVNIGILHASWVYVCWKKI
jgi:hypothetical protein